MENNEKKVKKYRQKSDKEKLIDRLSRIEGQVRGVKRMLENDEYCTDIILQAAAVEAAINAFNREMISQHLKSCVAEDLKSGSTKKADELVETLSYIMR